MPTVVCALRVGQRDRPTHQGIDLFRCLVCAVACSSVPRAKIGRPSCDLVAGLCLCAGGRWQLIAKGVNGEQETLMDRGRLVRMKVWSLSVDAKDNYIWTMCP
jgi:hypothetical protein